MLSEKLHTYVEYIYSRVHYVDAVAGAHTAAIILCADIIENIGKIYLRLYLRSYLLMFSIFHQPDE